MVHQLSKYLPLLVIIPWLSACSMGQIVARTSTSIMDGSVEAMNQETDLELARVAMPATLKLIEGLIVEDPNNAELLIFAAQGFYGYAFAFVEAENKTRAIQLYKRGFEYGKRALQVHGLDIDLEHASIADLDPALSKMGKGAVPALFWTASCWAKQIDLQRHDPVKIADLASTERLMNRVLEHQPDFYYGSVYIYYGVYYGSRSPMFGGDFAKSDQAFDNARAVTGNKLLITDVLQAEYLERQRLDQQRFHHLLTNVIDNPVGSFPEMALVNQIARARARALLQQEEEWF